MAFTYTHTQVPMCPCTQAHSHSRPLRHGHSQSPSDDKEQFGKDKLIRMTQLWGEEGTQKSASHSGEEMETQRQDRGYQCCSR